MTLKFLLEILFISSSMSDVIYPASVCLIGDVQAEYDQIRDPRTLFGTYSSLDTTGIVIDESIVDTSAPIYKHSYFNETGGVSPDQYLFKIKSIGLSNGWGLSETLPDAGTTVTIFLTCFQDSLFDCIYDRWFWGYDKYEYPIPTVKVLGGDCSERICLQNLTLQLKADNDINKSNPAPGDYSKLDGELYRQWDNNTNNYEWINERDSSLRWYYRVNEDTDPNTGTPTYTYNWVYSENSGDRVACAPGYVESPLFCTTYVYAGFDPQTGRSYNNLSRTAMGIPYYAAGTNDIPTVWKLGVCGYTFAPTMEPTMEPTGTKAPTTNYCDYDGQTVNIGTTVTKACEHGYSGDNDIGHCLTGGQIGNWSKGCFKVSFSDNFIGWDDEIWMVDTPHGISGESVLAVDGSDSFTFKPEYSALIRRIKSQEQITWPLRVRATVEKRTNECNLWAIGLGPEWRVRSAYSSRVNWGCLGGETNKQFSLYNKTFRLYDSKCWYDDVDDTMDVSYTIQNNYERQGSIIKTSSNDCATLKLQVTDILSQNPWQDAYLWFGSYDSNEDTELRGKIDDKIVGRFDWIGYTQFFSDFDGSMEDIWDANDIANKQIISVMNPGHKLTSNSNFYQFTIPFSIRLGISKPETDGVFAHFVSLGGNEYVDDSTVDIVQFVWRDDAKIRLAYTQDNIFQTGYLNPTDCSWEEDDTTFDIQIDIDTEKIKVSDTLCNSVLVAEHYLHTIQTTLTLGFIFDDGNHDSTHSIEFEYIEVYQLPLSYAGDVANGETTSDVVTNIEDIFNTLSPTLRPTPAPNTAAPTVAECPSGCVRYSPDGCVRCSCDLDGQYDRSKCTTDIGCNSTEVLSAYCGLCDTDTQTCDSGPDAVRDVDNLCEFKECSDPQGNGNSAYVVCGAIGNVMGILMVWKML